MAQAHISGSSDRFKNHCALLTSFAKEVDMLMLLQKDIIAVPLIPLPIKPRYNIFQRFFRFLKALLHIG